LAQSFLPDYFGFQVSSPFSKLASYLSVFLFLWDISTRSFDFFGENSAVLVSYLKRYRYTFNSFRKVLASRYKHSCSNFHHQCICWFCKKYQKSSKTVPLTFRSFAGLDFLWTKAADFRPCVSSLSVFVGRGDPELAG